MNRRAFLAAIAAGLAAAADPDRLLWVPKRKVYSIAKPRLAVDYGRDSLTVESFWWEDFDGVHHQVRAPGFKGPVEDTPYKRLPFVRLDCADMAAVIFMQEMTREEFRARYPA